MTNHRKGLRIHYFSLIEMLIYVSTLSALSLFLFKFFHSTIKLNRQALVRSERYHQVTQLHKEWKAFIAETTPAEWRVKNEQEFVAGTQSLKETWAQVPIYTYKPKKPRKQEEVVKPKSSFGGAFDFFGPPSPQKTDKKEHAEIDTRDEEGETPAEPPEVRYVMRKNGTLTWMVGTSSKEIRLPRGAKFEFNIEKKGASPLAVLNVVFPEGFGFREETVRLVAVSHRKGGE